ncbi:MAG: hypothetical protein ACREQQ_09740 [Candidatus Binatia bacterium]
MPRTVQAVIEPDGKVRLLEEVSVRKARRALVTILDEASESATFTAVASEPALATDWDRLEEDAAWGALAAAAVVADDLGHRL